MERIGTHRVFWLTTKEGIAEFDAHRIDYIRENVFDISRETGIPYSGMRVRKTLVTGYAPDPIFKYLSSDKAVSDSMERWKISPSTPTYPPDVMSAETAKAEADYHLQQAKRFARAHR